MPALSQLLEKTSRALDFNPQLEAFRDGLAADLNDAYIHLSTQYPWLFLRKTDTITLKATATNANTSGTIEIPASNLRKITFTGYTPPSDWAGQQFVGPDGVAYTIGSVNTNLVYLTTAYSAAVTAGGADWSVKYSHYLLPPDLSEMRAFVSENDDQGMLVFMDDDNEEWFYMDKDSTGESRFILEATPVQILSPETAPTLAVAAGGSLVASTTYEYCYTFLYQGVESSPSPAARIATTASDLTVNVTALPNTQHTAGTLATDRQKRLYRRRVDGDGRWVQVTDRADSATTAADDGTDHVLVDDRLEQVLLFEQGPRMAVRAWYTPDEERVIQIRYQRRPRNLIAGSDAPEWPVQYHYLIVWWALQEICLQHGMPKQAKDFSALANRLLNQMKARHLTRSIRRRVRRSWAGATVRQSYGDPVKS